MAKAKYILMPGATGDIHTSGRIKSDSSKKTKFELSKPETLSQEDLEHLYENKHTNLVVKAEPKVEEKPPVKAPKKP